MARKLTRHVTLKVVRRFQGQETLETECGTDHQTATRPVFHSFQEIDDFYGISTKNNLPQNYMYISSLFAYTCKIIMETYFPLISIITLESMHIPSPAVAMFKFDLRL